MKAVLAGIGIVVGVIVFALTITWIAEGNNFFLYQYFAPRTEAVRRQTFEQSHAYQEGMVKELNAMQFEYVKADKAHKAALGDVILHRYADVDLAILTTDERVFLIQLKQENLR